MAHGGSKRARPTPGSYYKWALERGGAYVPLRLRRELQDACSAQERQDGTLGSPALALAAEERWSLHRLLGIHDVHDERSNAELVQLAMSRGLIGRAA